MCLLIALVDCVPGCPLVIGANREEFHDRPSSPPALLDTRPTIWGGRDLRGGGTWLGVNQYGLVAAVTNRPGPIRPEARSRGLLCLDALRTLRTPSPGAAAEALEKSLKERPYNPFNLFACDGNQGFLIAHEHETHFSGIPRGLSLVPNGDMNDPASPRVWRAQELLADLAFGGPDDAVAALAGILADHESGVPFRDMICLHGIESGTVSSSILAVWPRRIGQSRYLHVQGKPCEKPYGDYSFLLQHESSGGGPE